MALNNSKCNHPAPLHLKGLSKQASYEHTFIYTSVFVSHHISL